MIRHKNDQDLAQTALTISLSRARSVAIFVAKLTKETPSFKRREYLAIKDCIEVLGNSVDRLGQSVKELGRAGHAVAGEDFMWKMSNVQTWVSAALTDETTCLDGFSGRAMEGKVKKLIRLKVVHVAQVTSNALALAGAIVGAFGFLYAAQPQDKTKTDAGYPPGIGVKNSLIMLGVINFVGMLFTFLVPEPKGKSLEELSGEAEVEK
ncbi:hypothetical protein DY000_02012588 [Brassica cretica]|uniref:Pectinesterase inhibitor domain-containing protein n=1 Tax=Brassica cretica TaxID=69181 RepID=A0ABQ7D0X6_BRACR|nr:hypothetical protein DY000_02012588 [Brassica cretica]